MTVTHLPLPANPLPDLVPCAGLWDLFDSRRDDDHRKARQICARCPLRDDCRPPEKIITPPFPGTMGRPSDGTLASADGTWGGRLYHGGEPVDVPADEPDVEACPVCKAAPHDYCTTPGGKVRPPHKARVTPRMCAACGRAPAWPRSPRCEACRAVLRRRQVALYDQRRRTKGAA